MEDLNQRLHQQDAENSCIPMEKMVSYLHNKLNDPEIRTIEDHLQTCALCTASLENLDQEFRKGAFDKDQLDGFKTVFDKKVQELADEGRVVSFPRQRILQYAAIVLIIVLPFSYWIWTSQFAQNPEKLYIAHFEPYQNIIAPVTRNDKPSDALGKAMQFYDKGAYAEALPIFRELLVENPDDLSVQFYTALCYLSEGESPNAIHHLSKVEQKNDPVWESPAHWYLALAYLRTGNIDQAKFHIDRLMAGNSSYRQKAEALLSGIEAL